MIPKYENLFSMYYRHKYFADNLFTGFRLTPSNDSLDLMKRYGMVLKIFPDGFKIFYENTFAGTTRTRQMLLKDNIRLTFRLDLADPLFYNYTGYVAPGAGNNIFFFTNVPAEKRLTHFPGLLHHYRFVTEKELVTFDAAPHPLESTFSELYLSKPFGHIELQLNEQLEETMYISFLCQFTYWHYLLVNDNFKQWKNLAVIDRHSKRAFLSEGLLDMPDGRKAQAFLSKKSIAVTRVQNRSFSLVENYDPVNNKFQKNVIPVLPNPDINATTKIKGGKYETKMNISTIII
jgi:hypothetical protein